MRDHIRVLLTLDGCALGRELLTTVFRKCVLVCRRLDILLINPPREPTTMLAMLLLRLEHSGIDYRVTSAYGDMNEETLRYLRRYGGISALALTDTGQLSEETIKQIEQKGIKIISIMSPETAA